MSKGMTGMNGARGFVVLEDRFEDRFFLCRAIRECFPDAAIEEFVFSEEAFAFLKEQKDRKDLCVFVDVRLPGMDGLDFIRLCFEQIYAANGPSPEFIVVSGVIGPDERGAIEEDDRVKAFLPKPIIRDTLRAVVEG